MYGKGLHKVTYISKALIASRAANLSKEVSQRVIRPLAESLVATQREVSYDLDEMNTWVSWSDSSPPKSVLPPAGEFPLIDPDDFPKFLTPF